MPLVSARYPPPARPRVCTCVTRTPDMDMLSIWLWAVCVQGDTVLRAPKRKSLVFVHKLARYT